MKNLFLAFTLLFISFCSAYAQNKTIKGRVVNEGGETILFASIMINDTVKVGQTDLDGNFNVEIPSNVKNIIILDIGSEKAIIHLKDSCATVDVVVMAMYTYDFMTFKKIDKLRLKRFKELPAIHKLAFDKGVFTTETACYTQEFTPYYKKKRK